MKKEALEKDIKEATIKLLEMGRNLTYNTISDNCVYILSENLEFKTSNFNQLTKERKRINEKKKPMPLAQIVFDLKSLYENLYDVNLYIYKSKPTLTIIEIQYFSNLEFEIEYLENIKHRIPMLHCKVPIPPYSFEAEDKFDINWELGGVIHRWKMFWWRLKIKRMYKTLK